LDALEWGAFEVEIGLGLLSHFLEPWRGYTYLDIVLAWILHSLTPFANVQRRYTIIEMIDMRACLFLLLLKSCQHFLYVDYLHREMDVGSTCSGSLGVEKFAWEEDFAVFSQFF